MPFMIFSLGTSSTSCKGTWPGGASNSTQQLSARLTVSHALAGLIFQGLAEVSPLEFGRHGLRMRYFPGDVPPVAVPLAAPSSLIIPAGDQ